MIYAILAATALLLPTGEDPRLEPHPVTVRKRNGKWELRLRVRADFPDGTILNVSVQPRVLRFVDTRQELIWDEIESSAMKRRAQVRRKNAELRVSMGKLQSIRVIYKVDPYRQRNGLKLKKPVVVVQDPFQTGTVTDRLKHMESGYDYTMRMSPQLAKLISQLEKAAKVSNPRRLITQIVNEVIKFRQKTCYRQLEEGAYPGTVGYLDSVSADVITLCSWLTSEESKKHEKENGGSGGGNGGQGPESPSALDDPDGENNGGSGGGNEPYSSEGLKDKGAGNIRTESFTRLGKLLDIIPDLHRAEMFLLLLSEARGMVEKAREKVDIDPKSVARLRKSLEFAEKKLGEERLPVVTMGILQGTCNFLDKVIGGSLPTEESLKKLTEALEAEERKISQVGR